MTERSRLEYCVVHYTANIVSDENVPIAAIVFDFSDIENGTCMMAFAKGWQAEILRLDPYGDLEMLKSLLGEIQDRLLSPGKRSEMIRELEDSFSNAVQVSERRRCLVPPKPESIETFAHRLLDGLVDSCC